MAENREKQGRISFSELGRRATDPEIVRLMNLALGNPDLLSMAAGFTDNAVMPVNIVRDIVSELADSTQDAEYLQYGTNAGRPGLRREVARLIAAYPGEREDAADPDQILISNGSQQSLYLAVQVLCDPGDVVLVEQPSYFVFFEALKGCGVQPVSIPSHPDGRIDFSGLRELIGGLIRTPEPCRVKAVYIVSYFSNPSSRCIPAEDKIALGELLRSLPVTLPVIEDGAYRDLYYNEPYPAPSVLSTASFDGHPVMYAGTFTKPFATGMKVGFSCCRDERWCGKILNIKGQQDFGTANFSQAIIERLLSGERYGRLLGGLRRHYARKMELLHETLINEGLPEIGWTWEKPEGGLLMWLKGPDGLDTGLESPFCQACVGAGVLYVPGELCFAAGEPRHSLRLAIGSP
jgi:2-aminoadipate transaminase